ncbi:hypothetical protein [Streptomyces sp. NPDC001750]|uniref:hypothetical protein n=1 Tax=Streptomyces sp. NPDC001750 TaxID=3364607 RepID=UPI0036A2425A
MTSKPTPTIADYIDESVLLIRAIVGGEPSDPQRLIDLGRVLARHSSTTWRTLQDRRPNSGVLAIDLMRAVGNLAVARTAGEVRAALAERPSMDPHDYLRSLCLATLPAWPLTVDNAAPVVVYRRGGRGFGPLWDAVGLGDEAEIERISDQIIQGATDFWARGLGD